MNKIIIDGENLAINQVYQAAHHQDTIVEISKDARGKIDRSRKFIEKILDDGEPHYGINTGFGDFEGVSISRGDLKNLQKNLVRSHSAGVGAPLPVHVVRAMMILRANALCRGNSGVRCYVIETLLKMLNQGVHPVVPSRGSVGASGDLAPLSHIALSLIGEGESEYKGKILPGGEALKQAGIEPVELMEKEGLALINGTQFMTAVGCLAVAEAGRILNIADAAGALSVEVLLGTDKSFIPQIQDVRPHPGQAESAKNVRKMLEGSEIVASHKNCKKVQDAYSLRCIPTVHGAAREGMKFAKRIISTESNSSVDNPLVFPEDNLVISGGNFHGAPVALALETLGLSLSFIGNISERRIERMMNHHYSCGLPPFLTKQGGLHSGYMIAQYAAASLVSENKVLCHPACCDSIPTSAGQEDHVSMGSISAIKILQILENVWNILAIEILCACEALECRSPLAPGKGSSVIYKAVRKRIPSLKEDRQTAKDIKNALEIIKNEDFAKEIEEIAGEIRD